MLRVMVSLFELLKRPMRFDSRAVSLNSLFCATVCIACAGCAHEVTRVQYETSVELTRSGEVVPFAATDQATLRALGVIDVTASVTGLLDDAQSSGQAVWANAVNEDSVSGEVVNHSKNTLCFALAQLAITSNFRAISAPLPVRRVAIFSIDASRHGKGKTDSTPKFDMPEKLCVAAGERKHYILHLDMSSVAPSGLLFDVVRDARGKAADYSISGNWVHISIPYSFGEQAGSMKAKFTATGVSTTRAYW